MYKSCRHNALRADMLVRPYGWFANIHGASGYGCTLTILFQQPHMGLLKKCGIVRIQSLAPFGFSFHKLDG